MKITKNHLKTLIKEELNKKFNEESLEEGFFDMFRGGPEPEAEPTQMDMFPVSGYGRSPSDSEIAKMAHDVILYPEMTVEQKAKELNRLASMVKRDGSLSSRIRQAAMYVGDADLPELAKAVKLYERKMN